LWPLSLRLRAIAAFAVVSVVLVGMLSVVTYALVRTWIVNDRRQSTERQAYSDARLVQNRLRTGNSGLVPLLSSLKFVESGDTLMKQGSLWYSSSVGVGSTDVPVSLQAVVGAKHAGWQMVSTSDGPVLAVGVPIADSSAQFYVLESMNDIQATLRRLAAALALAAGIAAVVGAGTGALVSRRILQPLRDVSVVAEAISAGEEDTRLTESADPDLGSLVSSFNSMVDELHERARREARFAADVSHDFRGPLAALSSAVSVVQRRQASLPPEAGSAIDVLQEQVEHFNKLVVDLLEISRFEAGTATLDIEEVDIVEFVRAVLDGWDVPVPLVCPADLISRVAIDKRRLHQVLANLLENARLYAGGVSSVIVASVDDRTVAIAVEDSGPGVPPELRTSIFTRYDRGRADRDPAMPKGTGLGLALAAQHVALHGGSIRVEDSPSGGARFVIELPEVPS
jgi:signal transduction histidine kinase